MRKNFILLTVCIMALVVISCKKRQAIDAITTTEAAKGKEAVKPAKSIQADTYITDKGDLKISLVGHASLIFEYKGKIIHVDPYSNVADYASLPKADLVMLTHEHSDHLDKEAIDKIKKAETRFIVSQACNDSLGYGEIMKNGDKKDFDGIIIDAVPAYNVVNKRPDGQFYHPKGRGNGYVFTFGDKKIYVAGDTENIPEMKALKDSIYIAFLPKNLPYTMTDDMFVNAAKTVNPTYLYPYHFSEFKENEIIKKMKGSNIKLLVRPMSNK